MSREPQDEAAQIDIDWTTVPFVRILADCGMMAAGYGLTEQASRILKSVHTIDPDSAVPDIGLAFSLLAADRKEEAITLLRKAETRVGEKDRAAVTAILGWMLQQTGYPAESRNVLERVGNEYGGPSSLATALLDPKTSN